MKKIYGLLGILVIIGFLFGVNSNVGAEASVVITDPDLAKMTEAINDGYITLDNGTIDNTTQTITRVQVTFQSNTSNAIFPTNTVITEASAGSFNFQNFITENTLTEEQGERPNAVGAVRLGIPNTNLSFSNDITVEITVPSVYNDMEMDVLSKLEGSSTWNNHTTCTITNGTCSFTTSHATTYSVENAEGSLEFTLESLEPVIGQSSIFAYLNTRVSQGQNPVTDLTVDNFQCTENGIEQADIFEVTPPETTSSVRLADIVVLIDTSGSMGSAINGVKNNAISFADTLADSEIDFRLGLVQFGQSADSGNPIVFNEGNLIADASEFKGFVETLSASGSYEPGFLALREATQQFNFRPGAQKIFLLITDEDSDDRDKESTVALMQENDIVVHTAVKCDAGNSDIDYCDEASVRGQTDGLLFGVEGPYDQILDGIAEQVAATYVISYRSSNSNLDGAIRNVECTVSKDGKEDIIMGSYTPGAVPEIELSPQTKQLNKSVLSEDSADAIVRVSVTDLAEPFVLADGVKLFYQTIGSTNPFDSVIMQKNGDYYEVTIPEVKRYGISYYVTATDGQSTSSLPSVDPGTSPFHIAVLPNVAPEIIHVPVTSVEVSTDITITATITDDTDSLEEAIVKYREIGKLSFEEVPMILTGEDNFEATIPAENVTRDIEYFITAKDNHSVISFEGTLDEPFLIKVGDETNEEIKIRLEKGQDGELVGFSGSSAQSVWCGYHRGPISLVIGSASDSLVDGEYQIRLADSGVIDSAGEAPFPDDEYFIRVYSDSNFISCLGDNYLDYQEFDWKDNNFYYPDNPQCSDGIDNDDEEDELDDEADPGCHTDGDVNNLDSYDVEDNNESDEVVIIDNPIYGIPKEFTFENNLTLGSYSYDVLYLQIILNQFSESKLYGEENDFCTKDRSNDGATGCESRTFGTITRNAVARFQDKIKINKEIIEIEDGLDDSFKCENNIGQFGCGNVGPITRKHLDVIKKEGLLLREDYGQLLNDKERKEIIQKMSVPNYLGQFPKTLLLGLIYHESSKNFNNEFRSFDWGRGITQVTSDDGMESSDCVNNSNCLDCRNRDNSNYQCQKYYSNTKNGIQRNLNDGLHILLDKETSLDGVTFKDVSTKDICEIDVLSASDLKYLSILDRYNGIQFQAQAIYKKYSKMSNADILDEFEKKYGSVPKLKYVYYDKKSDIKYYWDNNTWLDAIGVQCEQSENFSSCWAGLVGVKYDLRCEKADEEFGYCKVAEQDDEIHAGEINLATNALYLQKISNDLDNIAKNESDYDLWKKKLTCADTTKFITFIASPASLMHIVDNAFVGSEVQTQSNSYTIDSGTVISFFSEKELHFQIIGEDVGVYDFISFNPFTAEEIIIKSIPTNKEEKHAIDVDWGYSGDNIKVMMSIDKDGDGEIDHTVEVGSEFSDAIAPTTSIKVGGEIENWHRGDAEVTLIAEDNEGGVGVEKTEYSLDGGTTWTEYTEPFMVTGEGIHSVQYRSIDWFGNEEKIKTAEIKIDMTAPEMEVMPKEDEIGFDILGTDNLSTATVSQDGDKTYIITDEAGNTLRVEFDKIKEYHNIAILKVKSLQYNDSEVQSVSKNRIHYVWKSEVSKKQWWQWLRDRGERELTLINQNIELFRHFRINARYNQRKDQTKVFIHEHGKPQRDIFEGLKILELKTNNGRLEYSY